MKKGILWIFIILVISVNFIIARGSTLSACKDFIELQNTAYATQPEEGFTCYSQLQFLIGGRTLECNTPCCYRLDYSWGQEGGKCTGHFDTCSD